MTTKKLELNLDSTALGSSGCIRDLIQTLVGDVFNPEMGAYREPVLNVELVYGTAVHDFIDMMYKTGGNYHTALKSAKDLFHSIPFIIKDKKPWMGDDKHLATTCYMVWSEYVEKESSFDVLLVKQKCWMCKGTGEFHDTTCTRCKGDKIIDGPATEITFKIPYYEDDYIIINLCGTQDRVGKFKGGCFAISDWKTTGSWDNEGYFEQYELSRQLRFYRLACTLMAERHPESVLGQVGASHMGAFIEGIFLKPNANETNCRRSNVFQFSPQDITDFRRTLDDKIQEISHAVKTDYYPKQGILTGGCEKKFSKCRFWDVCKSNDNVARVLLNRNFIRKVYDPLNFNT